MKPWVLYGVQGRDNRVQGWKKVAALKAPVLSQEEGRKQSQRGQAESKKGGGRGL